MSLSTWLEPHPEGLTCPRCRTGSMPPIDGLQSLGRASCSIIHATSWLKTCAIADSLNDVHGTPDSGPAIPALGSPGRSSPPPSPPLSVLPLSPPYTPMPDLNRS